MKRFALIGVAALLSCPLFGGAVFGGLEDWNGLDYDYNDVLFSLKANNLSLQSSGHYFSEPVLGTNGTPFWNHSSLDGPQSNVGYCIYGGGACNGGTGLASGYKYLAANQTSTGSVNDVTFTANGQVQLSVLLQNTLAKDRLGWYAVSDPSAVYWLNPVGTIGTYSFTPGGAFGLVAATLGASGGGYTYFSQDWYGSADAVSHFAFFANASTVTPEPGIGGLALCGLLGIALMLAPRKVRLGAR